MKYTEEEINFLIENYSKYGGYFCSLHLKRNLESIGAKARSMGLYCKNKEVHDSLRSVSFEQFKNITKKEVAYFLGYFWADGNIINYVSKKINHWRICLEIVKEDAEDILNIMQKIGNWSIVKRKRKEGWKETWSFVANNKDLYKFLEENDYKEKSILEPSKILDKIPEELKIYFWRGYFDGDGSCGIVGTYNSYFEISSTYQYQYTEIKKLCDDLKIENYKIYRSISKKGHRSSVFKIYGKKNKKIADFLLTSDLGLKRKTEKLNIIKQFSLKNVI
jgi:DNA-binding transcriptional regulator WhiA